MALHLTTYSARPGTPSPAPPSSTTGEATTRRSRRVSSQRIDTSRPIDKGNLMSFLARTPICPASVSTDLGKAFEAHDAIYCRDKIYRLTGYDVAWLNV